jgi:hypothetical protein
MKSTKPLLSLAALAGLVLATGSAHAALIAHYTFDSAYDTNKTADSVGSAFATLGDRVQINTTVAGKIGSGALEMLGGGNIQGPGNGAVTSNSFSWANDARTVTFWWRADSPNVNTTDGTFVSFGTEPSNGARFDIKEQHAGATQTTLRVEVQGAGQGTNPTNFDDGNWHFVAVTVPTVGTAGDGGAAFRDVSWYVNGGTIDLNTSTNTLAIATGTGPIAFGDSIVSTITNPAATNDRVPNGFLDDFQLYDEVLTTEQISFLYNNPGSVIPEPRAAILGGLGLLALLRRRRSSGE